jgi:hypothetical protein
MLSLIKRFISHSKKADYNGQQLRDWCTQLFHEKHEMIMEDRNQLNKIMELLHEKHEMIMEDRNQLNKVMGLFHEKHEMILADRKEIRHLLKSIILNYYRDIRVNEEQKEVLAWLKINEVQMYPYDFFFEYMKKDCEVLIDIDEWKYVLYEDKRVYFPKSYSDERIRSYYRFLIMEQDAHSPHCYFDSNYFIDSNQVFIDAGAAEGLITLKYIDIINKAFLIECDNDWCEALNKTFEPYMDKVKIIDKAAASVSSCNSIALKDLIEENKSYVIKIDVEGNEMSVLNGLEGVSLTEGSKIVVCAYHNQQDEKQISDFFKINDINFEHTQGYLFSDWGGYQEPYLRRGLLRANTDHNTYIKAHLDCF